MREVKVGDKIVVTQLNEELIAPTEVEVVEVKNGIISFVPFIYQKECEIDCVYANFSAIDIWHFADEPVDEKRQPKPGDKIVLTHTDGYTITPTELTVERVLKDGDLWTTELYTDHDGDCYNRVTDIDTWYFADETPSYDDEALGEPYHEAAAKGKTLADFSGEQFTAESLSFVSAEEKALQTITPQSLSFVEAVGDNVNHPSHYNTGKTEVIDILEDLAGRYNDPVDAYLVATAAKYLFRSPFKGAQAEDIRKAVWYLNRLADRLDDHLT